MKDHEDRFPTCRHCGARIELIRFALGPQWMHWPSPWGNYRTAEKYEHCRQRRAEPAEQEATR